ncbi:MAG: hypothetical protein ACFE9Z_04595 [Promethearchaeota archaeon]
MKYKNLRESLSLDNPNVQKIIEIAKDLIEQNKVIKLKKLYNIAVRTLNIPGQYVLEIIHYLNNNKILINGSKHTKDTILLNLYRDNILNVIYTFNGATFSFLKEKIFTKHSGSSGQLIWHLNMLLKFKYIKKIKIGNYSLFLPIDLDDDLGKLYFFMNDDLNRNIILTFLNSEKIKKQDVYKIVNFKRENVNYRLKVLIDHQILTYTNNNSHEIMISKRMRELFFRKFKTKE